LGVRPQANERSWRAHEGMNAQIIKPFSYATNVDEHEKRDFLKWYEINRDRLGWQVDIDHVRDVLYGTGAWAVAMRSEPDNWWQLLLREYATCAP
jgi:hypothetical protein